MAFCTKCGTQFEAGTTFCGNCGTTVAAGATPVSEGVCKFFLEEQHMKGIGCVIKVDEGGRRTVAAVDFDAAPGQ